jgi:hypothetical protein
MEKNQDQGLQFVPVTEGLGFHPFSDGLPYAPVSKTQGQTAASPLTKGVGAVSAGSPTFAFPKPSAGAATARVSVPVAPQLISPPRPQMAPQPARPGVETTRKNPPAEQRLIPEERPGYIYVLKRFVAYGVDLLLSASIAISLLFAWQAWDPRGLGKLLDPISIEMLGALGLVFHWVLLFLTEVVFLSSFGKRLMGLKLAASRSEAILRAFFFVPVAAFGGLGILWALVDRRKRCWHDHIVDSQPIEVARL